MKKVLRIVQAVIIASVLFSGSGSFLAGDPGGGGGHKSVMTDPGGGGGHKIKSIDTKTVD